MGGGAKQGFECGEKRRTYVEQVTRRKDVQVAVRAMQEAGE